MQTKCPNNVMHPTYHLIDLMFRHNVGTRCQAIDNKSLHSSYSMMCSFDTLVLLLENQHSSLYHYLFVNVVDSYYHNVH